MKAFRAFMGEPPFAMTYIFGTRGESPKATTWSSLRLSRSSLGVLLTRANFVSGAAPGEG